MKKSLPASPGPRSILLVDDNHHGMVARKTVLEELGYRVSTAVSGEEGCDLYARERFDVVVTDYKMPRMNGVDVIKSIRGINGDAKIILLSGFVEALGLTEQSTGADVVILKSNHELSHLIRSVDRLLHGRTPRKPAGSQPVAKRNQKSAFSS